MDKRKILIQLDSDAQPSVFDRVVAIDAGADEVFSYGGVRPEQVRDLVHGAIFTRGPKDLKSTAIFIGGSDVTAGEKLLEEARRHMLPQFGLRVSMLLDANGANTTAAAAVRVASQHLGNFSITLGGPRSCELLHLGLKGVAGLVLGGTGPVGQRVARLLARQGAHVRVGSRQLARAEKVCDLIRTKVPGAQVEAIATGASGELRAALKELIFVTSAGAAGAVLLPKAERVSSSGLKLAIDLNAVPPLGIEGVEVADKGTQRDGVICYGAIGVGDTKMKIHKAAIAKLFESNDQIMDAEEVYALATSIA
jgi:hypothetical protein